MLLDKMPAWRESVLAADAEKAGSASDATRLTPRPPSLTGRLAWSHWVSDKSELVMRWTALFSSESKLSRDGWDTDGEQRRRWRTFGALKEDLSRISASWELTKFNLSTALARSSHRSDQALSSTGPSNRGAPNSVAALTSTLVNDCRRSSYLLIIIIFLLLIIIIIIIITLLNMTRADPLFSVCCFSALEVLSNKMRYINTRFTYLNIMQFDYTQYTANADATQLSS